MIRKISHLGDFFHYEVKWLLIQVGICPVLDQRDRIRHDHAYAFFIERLKISGSIDGIDDQSFADIIHFLRRGLLDQRLRHEIIRMIHVRYLGQISNVVRIPSGDDILVGSEDVGRFLIVAGEDDFLVHA